MPFASFTQNPNIIILMTDQQRAFRYFPQSWINENLPNFTQLQANGITFNNAICNASRCSPSRSVLYTGQYTWQTQVFAVGDTLPPTSANPTAIPTIGNLMQAAGYTMAYKGKWHLTANATMSNGTQLNFGNSAQTRPVNTTEANNEDTYLADTYAINAWTSPDAGTALLQYGLGKEPTGPPPDNSAYYTLGGSEIENDDRYVIGPNATNSQESAIDFLNNYQQSGSTAPFCLAVSLVNPHDVSVFPGLVENMAYWDDHSVWEGYTGFSLPPSYSDTLDTKPAIQKQFLDSVNTPDPFTSQLTPLQYLQFYAYLHTQPDQLFQQLLACMSQDLLNNTIIIRLADHGEMAMSHGGMRYKDLNAYQETINVPLVFSNPVLFPQSQSVNQLVGLVDLMPTLATIVGLTDEQKQAFDFKGIDFSPVLLDPGASTQDAMLYTYDDDTGLSAPHYIRTLVTAGYKFSVYYNTSNDAPTGNVLANSFQYELYDLTCDPDEMKNLLPVGGTASPAAQEMQKKLYAELTTKMKDTQTTPNEWPATLPGG
jgi:choline-sulfatase